MKKTEIIKVSIILLIIAATLLYFFTKDQKADKLIDAVGGHLPNTYVVISEKPLVIRFDSSTREMAEWAMSSNLLERFKRYDENTPDEEIRDTIVQDLNKMFENSYEINIYSDKFDAIDQGNNKLDVNFHYEFEKYYIEFIYVIN